MNIHPTALVDPDANIAEGVSIGPFCLIGPGVLVGQDTLIGPRVTLEQNVRIGRNCRIHTGATLGVDPQDRLYNGEQTFLDIGDDTTIREYAILARGSNGVTVVGSQCLIMAHAYVGHDCTLGRGSVLSNAVTLLDHVEIQEYGMIGANSFVNRFCRLGRLSFVGGGCRVHCDIPPFVVAGDEPLQISAINETALTKKGVSEQDTEAIRSIYKRWIGAKQSPETFLATLQSETNESDIVMELAAFFENSEKGILGMA